jgi:hypothetical protein
VVEEGRRGGGERGCRRQDGLGYRPSAMAVAWPAVVEDRWPERRKVRSRRAQTSWGSGGGRRGGVGEGRM